MIEKENKKKMTVRLTPELLKSLDEAAKHHKITKTAIVENGIKIMLDSLNERVEG